MTTKRYFISRARSVVAVALLIATSISGCNPFRSRRSAVPTPTESQYNPLWIPPAITGPTFNLNIAQSAKQFLPGAATPTYSYNGAGFWGPTLIMNAGDNVTLNVTNALTEVTTTHWHGLHVPAEMDGGPHQTIPAGATWRPSFTVMNKAATYWYHPHAHGLTMKQLNQGAGGFIIVRDAEEAALALPRTYGVDDIPLVLTSRSFGEDNAIKVDTIYGDTVLTNGTIDARVGLPAQVVRLRVLNGEIERAYNLGFGDNRTFYVIATDGGLVNAPVPVTRLTLSPGERFEILIDLTADPAGAVLDMRSYNRDQEFGFPGGEDATSGEFGSLLNNTTFTVLRIDVTGPAAGATAVTKIPGALARNTYWTASDAVDERAIAITDQGPGTPFTFDNASFAMSAMHQVVRLGVVEQWTVSNGATFGHAFHIHDVQFAIVSRSSGPVGPAERGWKDTFFIRPNESVSVVARFDDFASAENPYMYHCHMSNHEDGGLMGQFLVVR